MFYNFYLVKNHKIANNSTSTEPGMSGIVIGKKKNGTGRDGTGRNEIER